jgi:hypothetical protein
MDFAGARWTDQSDEVARTHTEARVLQDLLTAGVGKSEFHHFDGALQLTRMLLGGIYLRQFLEYRLGASVDGQQVEEGEHRLLSVTSATKMALNAP